MGMASNRKWTRRAARFWQRGVLGSVKEQYRRLFGHKGKFWRALARG